MSYYSQFGHKDFILCLGYKANIIKEFFLNYRPNIYADCVVSVSATRSKSFGDPRRTGGHHDRHRSVAQVGERLCAVRGTSRARRCFLPITAMASPT